MYSFLHAGLGYIISRCNFERRRCSLTPCGRLDRLKEITNRGYRVGPGKLGHSGAVPLQGNRAFLWRSEVGSRGVRVL